MEQLTDILRFFAIAQLLALVVLFIRSSGRKQDARLAALFCGSLIAYLIVDWNPLQEYWLFYLFLAAAFALPFSFWLFSKTLFDDNFKLEKRVFIFLAGIVVFSYGIYVQNHFPIFNLSESGRVLLRLAHHILSLLFVLLGVIQAVRDRSADLVVSRLRFRSLFILLAAIIMALTVLTEIAFSKEHPPLALDLLQKLIIFGLSFYFMLRRLEFKPGFFRPTEKTSSSPLEAGIDKKLIDRLLHLMEGEKIYHTEGLSIRRLADRLEVKEYKLRQTINRHLGFRNFNEFLNAYRIREACDILVDPEKKELTVLEIAYGLGYQSLAPFNKAFKKLTGTTPTQWRKMKR